ncbi:aldehyde dehydrogenase family protein [Comamonas odontotermitis]|uniref:aldehyde dehydrogenase family protein n=1 Tax=Comamonas odontotermitis TaxID=379895 RepID=UPI001CC7D1FD|nr:aldehyde dehydrogenase family protein [Comamonas odontotermitis]UBB17957.1 aldehyde dehydrogenase family protein [Comamonas odontotermitis]
MDVSELHSRFAAMRAASRAEPDTPLLRRRERLLRLQKLIADSADQICAAVQSDFGQRSAKVTELTELLPLRSQLAQALGQLKRWAAPQRVATPLHLLPTRAWVQPVPLGVIGVIAPWNYPVLLALGPAISALAAGNRVIVKPSEHTPATSALLAELVARYFADDEMAVLVGDAGAAADLAALPLDHLLFTGSTTVGRKVALAAANHLVPTTLELGGKTPCLLEAGCDIHDAARKIAHAKLLNAGQTCIAPDYVLLPAGSEAAFVDAYADAVRQMYPQQQGNPDYTSIINAAHTSRLLAMLAQAEQGGAQLVRMGDDQPAVPQSRMGEGISRQLAPVVVLGATPQMPLMQEEIFGPLLPVLCYDEREDAIAAINQGEIPLAFYWFGSDARQGLDAALRVRAAGVCMNDCLLQFVHDGLPFGGWGASGWGAIHGRHGFMRFSHAKPVLRASLWSPAKWLYPPYGGRFDGIMRMLKGKMLR